MKIYALSGLGADERVFNYLNLSAEIIPIPWIVPQKDEPLSAYALSLSEAIDTKEEFILLGVSFGGLVAVELAKQLSPKLTILISSAETKYELRSSFRLLGRLGLLRWIPSKYFDPPRKVIYWLFGTYHQDLLGQILDDTDWTFGKWASIELITWSNTAPIKGEVLKISGGKDRVIPPSKDPRIHLIPQGGHFMVVDLADEVSEVINGRLREGL